jgi:hypothetical protein
MGEHAHHGAGEEGVLQSHRAAGDAEMLEEMGEKVSALRMKAEIDIQEVLTKDQKDTFTQVEEEDEDDALDVLLVELSMVGS